ncbi:MAG: hypothetical protein EAZ91_13270 [Cytophagales bacterium]|nr:MAG: hypothetical protein EAZ91_13270 [Cytophagales bacterium]
MRVLVFILFAFIQSNSFGQQADVAPLNSRVVLVHVNEGYVQYHGNGQQNSNDVVVFQGAPLNTTAAGQTGSYALQSSDDPTYTLPQQPLSINRKSKGTAFAWFCDGWDNTLGCINSRPDHTKEHWIYLNLPQPLQPGKSYTLTTGSLANNGNVWAFTFDTHTSRSEAVHVNQVGYKPNAPLKFGYVYQWAGDGGSVPFNGYQGKAFQLIDVRTNQVAFSGTLAFRATPTLAETGQTDTPNGNFSGATVYECDFSCFRQPGTYRLAVDEVGCSFPFDIGNAVYNEPFRLVMNGLYKQRSGIELMTPYSDQPRPAPHNPTLTPGFANRLKYTTTRYPDVTNSDATPGDKAAWEAGLKGTIDTWGWYQDAGDWDAYFSHASVPATLMALFESFPDRFNDGQLNLPEQANGRPDLLDEARWLIRFYHRTRHAILDAGYGTGGVGGARVMGDLWGADAAPDGSGRGSWQDTTRDWYVSGEDPFMTYRYAGLAAQFAYCLTLAGVADPEGINWQQEATEAYAWATANIRSGDLNPRFDGALNLYHTRLYASAALFRLTGEQSYHSQFLSDWATLGTRNERAADSDAKYGAWLYALLPSTRIPDPTALTQVLAAVEAQADFSTFETANKRAARWGGNWYFPMLVGQSTSPMLTEGVLGYRILRDRKPAKASQYLPYFGTTADYFLGNNPLNQTWVTGLGERPPSQIFHLDSWFSLSAPGTVRTGVVPYGPWRVQDFGAMGPWNLNWPYRANAPTIYPTDITVWPGHERWFSQRSAPLTGEFTIHQSQLWSIVAYGALAALREPALPESGCVPVSSERIR